jgi:hypothetical protein
LISLSLSLSLKNLKPQTLIIHPILALGDCVYVCVLAWATNNNSM